MGRSDVLFAAGSAERVAEPIFKRSEGCGNDRMGPASAKFDPAMEDKDGQNPTQTAEIVAAADAGDRAKTSAINAHECSRRSTEEAYPANAHALWFDGQWFDHRCARDQTQRSVRLGENEGNRMRDKLPRTPLQP